MSTDIGKAHLETTRRDFMRYSSAALAAAAFAGTAATKVARAAAANDGKLRLGLIGCGGRGTGAMRNALLADNNTILYAMGDMFSDMVDDSLEKLKKSEAADRVTVDDKWKFTGFDAYQKVIECCDMVVLATPPAFRPAHLRAAVEAGRYIFCEKPVAVDGPGIRHVIESCDLAAKNGVVLVSGLCYRYENKKRETIKRIHEGAVGDIISIETVYNTSGLWHKGRKDNWTEMEYELRNWLYFDWLSGDHIVEQHIHSLDKMMWVMNDTPPLKATASGGRTVRTDAKYGNIYDHFNTVFEWESGVRGFSSCRQWENAVTAVYDNVYGTKGVAKVQEHAISGRDGSSWKWESAEKDDMYQNELNALFSAVRKGEVINNGDYMVKSNLAAIMARMSAYSGQTVTWDQALNSELSYLPEKLELGDLATRPAPVPGAAKYF
jgi:predicted dehydrogenase